MVEQAIQTQEGCSHGMQAPSPNLFPGPRGTRQPKKKDAAP